MAGETCGSIVQVKFQAVDDENFMMIWELYSVSKPCSLGNNTPYLLGDTAKK